MARANGSTALRRDAARTRRSASDAGDQAVSKQSGNHAFGLFHLQVGGGEGGATQRQFKRGTLFWCEFKFTAGADEDDVVAVLGDTRWRARLCLEAVAGVDRADMAYGEAIVCGGGGD